MNRDTGGAYSAVAGWDELTPRARIIHRATRGAAFSVLAVMFVLAPLVKIRAVVSPPIATFLVVGVAAFFLGAVLTELTVAVIVVRNWAVPLMTLAGMIMLAVLATPFPSRARRAWLNEVLEAFRLRREHEANWVEVLASFVATWPADLLDEWRDHLSSRTGDFDLTEAGGVADAEVPGGYWKRHRFEILWAAVSPFWPLSGTRCSPSGFTITATGGCGSSIIEPQTREA